MIIYVGADYIANYVIQNELYAYGFGWGQMNSTHTYMALLYDVIHSVCS